MSTLLYCTVLEFIGKYLSGAPYSSPSQYVALKTPHELLS